MIDPRLFLKELKSHGVDLFAGVPDSLLSDFCACIDDSKDIKHVISANEGNALAIASGYHLASSRIACVYMQNSGLGNAVNPLTSLNDREVFRIPAVLIIGWRGEPGYADEPQHVKQGKITEEQLNLLEVPYWILDAATNYVEMLNELFLKVVEINSPVAILVRRNTFSPYLNSRYENGFSMAREDAIEALVSLMSDEDLVIATTGKTSRELYEIKIRQNKVSSDFLTVGCMGHTSSIALGLALAQPNRRVICLDGDGSLLMHMGAVPIIGAVKPSNFIHILLNNSAHESVGGQPTVAKDIDFESIYQGLGYKAYYQATDLHDISDIWRMIQGQVGPIMFEIKIKLGSRSNLGRPSCTPEQNKKVFMKHAMDN